MTEPETSDPFRTYLKIAVSGLLTELGFSTAEAAALETLTELTQSFLVELGRSARSYCELACQRPSRSLPSASYSLLATS